MSRITRYALPILAVIALILTACQPQVVEVTKEVEVEVTRVVEVEKEVEVPVEVEVEVTAVPGRCAPMSADDVEEIKIGATVPQSAPGAIAGGRAMMTAINIAVAQINDDGGILGKPVKVIFQR